MAHDGLLDWRRAGTSGWALTLAALLWLALAATPVGAQALAFADALAADDTGLGRYPAEAAQRVVSLPDDWSHSRPLQRLPLWYRLRFDASGAASQPGLLGLYIERACANVEDRKSVV